MWILNNVYQYKTSLTKKGADNGIDIIGITPEGGKVIVQCKRYKKTVDISHVERFIFTKKNEGVKKAIFMTTSQFSPKTQNVAKRNGVVLINGDRLLLLAKNIRQKVIKKALQN